MLFFLFRIDGKYFTSLKDLRIIFSNPFQSFIKADTQMLKGSRDIQGYVLMREIVSD